MTEMADVVELDIYKQKLILAGFNLGLEVAAATGAGRQLDLATPADSLMVETLLAHWQNSQQPHIANTRDTAMAAVLSYLRF